MAPVNLGKTWSDRRLPFEAVALNLYYSVKFLQRLALPAQPSSSR